jgi:hypothetical protein
MAGKPEQVALKTKFEKALDEKLNIKAKSEFKKESFRSPDGKKTVPAIKRPYMAVANGLDQDDILSARPNFKTLLFRAAKPSKKLISEDDFPLLPTSEPVKKAKKKRLKS